MVILHGVAFWFALRLVPVFWRRIRLRAECGLLLHGRNYGVLGVKAALDQKKIPDSA